MNKYSKEYSGAQISGLPTSRANRLRTSWFVVGTVFGIGMSLAGQWVSGLSMPEMNFTLTKDEPQQVEAAPTIAEPKIVIPEPPKWPKKEEVVISSGDNLISILTEHGVAHKAAFDLVQKMKKTFDPRKLKVGHKINLTLGHDEKREGDDAAWLKTMIITLSKIEQVSVTGNESGDFQVKKIKKPVTTELNWGQGTIDSSLYLSAQREGVPNGTIANMIREYSYDIDFQRDIREGDEFEALYEKKVTNDGEFVGSGNLIYAELKTRGKTFRIYRHQKADGTVLYYTPKGESVKKALLKTPIDGARISSKFGMRRHPILGYSKMHTGIDFAAPRGTPIYAAGDGTVSFASRKGGYGNYLMIRHNGTYSTAYAHLNRFGKGIRRGSRVKQGQVVAYVGTTGRSTGPHLHYEIVKNGRKVNPAGIKFAGGDVLKGKEKDRFNRTVANAQTQIAELRKAKESRIAAAETDAMLPPVASKPAKEITNE